MKSSKRAPHSPSLRAARSSKNEQGKARDEACFIKVLFMWRHLEEAFPKKRSKRTRRRSFGIIQKKCTSVRFRQKSNPLPVFQSYDSVLKCKKKAPLRTTKIGTSFRLMKFEVDKARDIADSMGIRFTEFIEICIHEGNEKYAARYHLKSCSK